MYNIIGYILYLSITFYITLIVGLKVYRIGYVYLRNLIVNHSICQSINNLLLLGYYLVNLGFSAICLNNWEFISCYTQLVEVVCIKIGQILLVLGVLHFLNMSAIYLASKNKTINTKSYGNKF